MVAQCQPSILTWLLLILNSTLIPIAQSCCCLSIFRLFLTLSADFENYITFYQNSSFFYLLVRNMFLLLASKHPTNSALKVEYGGKGISWLLRYKLSKDNEANAIHMALSNQREGRVVGNH